MTNLMQGLNFVVADEVNTPPIDHGKHLIGNDLRMADLVEANQVFDDWKRDYEFNAADFLMADDGTLLVPNAENPNHGIEDYALGQIGQKFGRPFYGKGLDRDYTRALMTNLPQHYAPIWNDHAKGYGKDMFVRTYGDQVRAALSDRFTHIDNADVLQILGDFLDNKQGGNYKLVRPYIGRDSLTVKVIIGGGDAGGIKVPGMEDSVYGIGCAVRTGETGNVSPEVVPLIQRHACTNSIVVREKGTKLRQVGDRHAKMMILIGAMAEALQESGEIVNRMLEAQYEQLPSFDKILGNLSEANGWGQEFSMTVARGTENAKTTMGIVNGLTYAAHAADLPAETMFEVESLAGKLLMAGKDHIEYAYR